MPMGQTDTPSWEWVQRRLPGVKLLTLETYCRHNRQVAVELEGELITAHLLLALSNPQICKLQEIYIEPSYYSQDRCPKLDDQVYKAISCFTSLTTLTLNSLEVDIADLQVSRRSICAVMKDPPHNENVYITEGQHVFWQGLSGLSSLRNFYCNSLRCLQHAEDEFWSFSCAVAQSLWTLALGWPQLMALEFFDCTLSTAAILRHLLASARSGRTWCDVSRAWRRLDMFCSVRWDLQCGCRPCWHLSCGTAHARRSKTPIVDSRGGVAFDCMQWLHVMLQSRCHFVSGKLAVWTAKL